MHYERMEMSETSTKTVFQIAEEGPDFDELMVQLTDRKTGRKYAKTVEYLYYYPSKDLVLFALDDTDEKFRFPWDKHIHLDLFTVNRCGNIVMLEEEDPLFAVGEMILHFLQNDKES